MTRVLIHLTLAALVLSILGGAVFVGGELYAVEPISRTGAWLTAPFTLLSLAFIAVLAVGVAAMAITGTWRVLSRPFARWLGRMRD